jgi:hypothetical protein
MSVNVEIPVSRLQSVMSKVASLLTEAGNRIEKQAGEAAVFSKFAEHITDRLIADGQVKLADKAAFMAELNTHGLSKVAEVISYLSTRAGAPIPAGRATAEPSSRSTKQAEWEKGGKDAFWQELWKH